MVKQVRQYRRKVEVQADGGLCGALRRDKRLATARLCAVALTYEGCDYWGQYQGRTGVPLYALEYPDKEVVFLRRKNFVGFCRELRRRYPLAKITLENIRGLNPHPRRLFQAWPNSLKQLRMEFMNDEK
jgi:hypothetical protein